MYSFTGNEYIEKAVENYSDAMLNAAYSILKSTADAEDVVQEAFLKYIRKKPVFNSDEHEKAWLIRVTINCSKNLLNSSFLKNTTEMKEDIAFETKERHDIYYAVQDLPIKYRTIIYLFYYEGYKINEISKILKMNENTIKARLRGKEKAKITVKK